jgi:hypothetical protein
MSVMRSALLVGCIAIGVDCLHPNGAMAAERVGFIVEYTDGSTVRITIDRNALRRGDQIVRSIAERRKRVGNLPEGEIAKVRREPND